MTAVGSVLTNKYAEGYPGRRYYGGCEYVDVVETLAIDRAKQLFGAEHANVQPHAGAQANFATFFALLEPGDRILSQSLANGGHLSHGLPVNVSGKWFTVQHYDLEPGTDLIDYDALAKQAEEFRPKLIIAGFSAYSRHLDFARFRAIADSVGALLDGGHRTCRGVGGGGRISLAHRLCACDDDHHAQDAARAARRADSLQRRTREGDRQSGPARYPGRAVDARYRGQGDRLRRGAPAGIQAVRHRCRRERPPPRRRVAGARHAHRLRRHGQPPDARRSGEERHRHERQDGGEAARQRRDHGEQEHRARRDALGDAGERYSPRHAGDHDARHGPAGDGRGRGLDRH